MQAADLEKALSRVRSTMPLVHSITNYVTANDCANALLAIGASPIMSYEPEDVVDITSICTGLVLNIGTLEKRSIKGMHAAAQRASELHHAIVLDPVGAGASALRTRTASSLLDDYPVSIVRGNMSEVKALASGSASTHGVDACIFDAVTRENIVQSAEFAIDFARRSKSVVAITSAIDIIADGTRAFAVFNGSPLQGRITGAGCMLTCLTAAFAAAADDGDDLVAATAAVCAMGVAGDIAERRMQPEDGNGSFRMYLLDALYNLQGRDLASLARFEEIRA